MSLANPLALLWALLLVPIVIFYILKIRLKRVPVSTVLFWRQIFDEKKPRSLWQRLRHLVSLLCQLAFLFLIVFALTKPLFSWEALNARRVILVLDNSASMNATDVAPSRLERAKQEALKVIGGLRFQDEMAIVTAGTPPHVVCGLTGHQRTLEGIVQNVEPTDGPSQVPLAIALARRLTTETDSSGKQNRIVLISDGCGAGVADLAKASDVTVIGVGQRTANLAITRFQVRRSTIDPIGYEILAEVMNFADEPAGDVRLSIALEGRPIDIKPLKFGPDNRWSEVIESTTADGGLLTAELVMKCDKGFVPYTDALATDNRAAAVLPKREPIPVHMHSPGGNLFLQKVLEASPLVRLTTSKQMPKEFAAGSVSVFHRETPAKLPPGPVMIVDPTGACDLFKVGEVLQNPIVTQQDRESPLMSHVRLDNVILPEARKLTFLPAAGKPQILAGGVSGDPLFALIDRPEGKVAVLTVNLDKGDLPFRTAFPILAMNVFSAFTSASSELREALAAGATTEVTLPATTAGVSEFVLRDPSGKSRPLPPGGAKVTIGPFDRCGVWAVAPSGTGAAPLEEYAVNLMNKSESDLRPPDSFAVATTAAEAGLSGGLLGGPVWWYLALLAWALVAVEWYLYQRRWIS
ncbi:BatA and WFA domain-containing protein [soil metagenome]